MIQHDMVWDPEYTRIVFHRTIRIQNNLLQHHRQTRGGRYITLAASYSPTLHAAAVPVIIAVPLHEFPKVAGNFIGVAFVGPCEGGQELGRRVVSVMVTVRVCVWGVKGLGGELATERWHVVRVDFKIVDEDASVVDCGGERIRGAHVAINNEFEVMSAGRKRDNGRPG